MIVKPILATIEFMKNVSVLAWLVLMICMVCLLFFNHAFFVDQAGFATSNYISGLIYGSVFFLPIIFFASIDLKTRGGNYTWASILKSCLSFLLILIVLSIMNSMVFIIMFIAVPRLMVDVPQFLERTEVSLIFSFFIIYLAIRLCFGLPSVLSSEKRFFQIQKFWKSSSKVSLFIAALSLIIAVVSEAIWLYLGDSFIVTYIAAMWIIFYSVFIGAFITGSVVD